METLKSNKISFIFFIWQVVAINFILNNKKKKTKSNKVFFYLIAKRENKKKGQIFEIFIYLILEMVFLALIQRRRKKTH
jgi:hypothetical protein